MLPIRFFYLFFAAVSMCLCEAAEITPDPKIQAEIEKIAIQLGSGTTQKEGLIALKHLEQMHTNKTFLVQQVLWYMRYSAKTENRGYGAMGIMNKMEVDRATKIKAVLPQLEESDVDLREMASHVLRSVDKDKSNVNGVDFGIYENLLKETQTNPPSALVRYMFDRNPQAAVVAVARVYGKDVPESEVTTKAKSGIKESVNYFAGRSEWWAHLYVAAMMEKEPYLRTPEMIKKLEQDPDPLVREKVTKLKQNQSSSKLIVNVSQQTTNQTAVGVPQVPGSGKTNDLGNTVKP